MGREGRIATNTDTAFLKSVAMASMLVDHVGAVLFPGVMFFRVIGRLAFPLFAYCTVLGCIYTHDIKRYLLRLLLFACIAQPIYLWLFGAYPFKLNIIYTLALGVSAIYLKKEGHFVLSTAIAVVALFLPVEYGYWAVLLMVFMFISLENEYLLGIAAFLVLLFAYPLGLQSFAVFALPLVLVKTDYQPQISKWFSYFFYPVHLAILGVIRLLVVR